jgi:hypothetical protein
LRFSLFRFQPNIRADFLRGRRPSAQIVRRLGAGQPPLPLKYVRICSKTFTILEIESGLGSALAAPPSADSAAKA